MYTLLRTVRYLIDNVLDVFVDFLMILLANPPAFQLLLLSVCGLCVYGYHKLKKLE